MGTARSGSLHKPAPPLRVALDGKARAIAAGMRHSAYLMDDGTVFAAGFLPEADDGAPHDPVIKPGPVPISGVRAVAAWGFHTLFILANGTVLAAGENEDGQMGSGGHLEGHVNALVPTARHMDRAAGTIAADVI